MNCASAMSVATDPDTDCPLVVQSLSSQCTATDCTRIGQRLSRHRTAAVSVVVRICSVGEETCSGRCTDARKAHGHCTVTVKSPSWSVYTVRVQSVTVQSLPFCATYPCRVAAQPLHSLHLSSTIYQPLYLSASSSSSFPLVRSMVVALSSSGR